MLGSMFVQPAAAISASIPALQTAGAVEKSASQKRSVKIFALLNTRADQSFAYATYYAQTYGAAKGTKVRFQRFVKGRWKTLKTARVKMVDSRTQVGQVRFNFNTSTLTSKSSRFRFLVVGTKNQTSAVQTFSAHGSAKKYRAYEKRAKNYIKKWCPGVPVYARKISGDASGLAYADYMDYGGRTGLAVSGYIQIAPGMNAQQLRSIATHECAHILQQRAAIRSGKTVKRVQGYRARGVVSQTEIEADCMATVMMGRRPNSAYTQHKPCSKRELRKARKVVNQYRKVVVKQRGTFTQRQARNSFVRVHG